jgi:hypothetical protein
MRMIIPGLRERRTVDRLLSLSFREHRLGAFRRAIAAMSRFYLLPCPRVDWYEYLDWGKTAGRTYENGRIHLVHPENWKRGRKYNSERQWIHTVYHEMGHYVLWADAERKADGFAYQFVRGVSGQERGSDRRTYRLAEMSRARRKRAASTRRSGAKRSRPPHRRRRARSR